MGAEIAKLEGHDIYVVLDNTSDMVKEFCDFKSCIEAFKYFGRDIKEYPQQELIDHYENLDHEEEFIEEQIRLVKEFFAEPKAELPMTSREYHEEEYRAGVL